MPPAPKSNPPPRQKTPSRFSDSLDTQGIAEAARWISREMNSATGSMTTAVSTAPRHTTAIGPPRPAQSKTR